jgi:dCMP deaminase
VIVNDDNIIKATGYNSFPRGIDDDRPERQSREGGVKYAFFEHAERNAIYSAAREGVSLKGCRIYVSAMPCADCARGIIQAGIKEVIIDATWQAEMEAIGKWRNWKDSHRYANEMFSEAGVKVRAITARLIPVARYADGATF